MNRTLGEQVAQKDLKAFKSLPTNTAAGGEVTLYGRVLRDSEAHDVFVRLIGRNAPVDSPGNATIAW